MSSRKFILLLAVLLAAVQPARSEVSVGDLLPEFAGREMEGVLPETAGRVLLVDFWASWCSPCHASFPALAGIHADFRDRGVVLVGVSVDRKAADYARFLQRHRPPFATLRDAAQKFVAAVQVPAMPTSLIVGRDRRVRAVVAGYHGEETEQKIRTALAAALAEEPKT